ncbi:UDP-3-O-(3-hydroxymyristoyl)glucosamine N-acyltransferase [Arenimonas composti]|uniref:UDP-3-O-acylglucosamine N-acyltransferase n=1 Tax=Arenimonas composti TR7-09 = DSM 18010 TaxID=1121013 RepID=A0A091BD16_9GAMM|nr:UDP-3-O-(3-hydroxymyristoyl)glucosamine N-acyltransferase [Arenimonas composti]KFN49631.1 hypothetical protein P873_09700 [Arenimonas composti TR7-09 = DSM 18010]
MPANAYRLAELAADFGLELRGNADVLIDGVGTLASAGPGQLSFLANPAYRRELAATAAGAVVLAAGDADACPVPCLVARSPYAAFAKIAARFETVPAVVPGIHPSAVVAADAVVDPTASVGPLCSIGSGSRIGAGALLGPGCIIGDDNEIGPGCVLVARVTLVTRVHLGARVRIHPGAVLGADGFGLAMDAGHWLKVPQLGGVRVGDDSEIGANTTIDRGALEDTELGVDVRLDNQIQVGHGVRIGDHTAIAGATAIAGSARIGARCLIGGGVGIAGHLRIADGVTVTAMSLVTGSIDQPGEYSGALGVLPTRTWRRNAARFRRLDELARRMSGPADD